jgi:hypothetical protein
MYITLLVGVDLITESLIIVKIMNPSLPSRRFSVPAYLGLQRTQLNLIKSKTFYIKVISIRVPEAATLCLDDQFDHGA